MASPQVEDGYTRIANELLEAFAMFRIAGKEVQVIWAILRLTYGYGQKEAVIPYRKIAVMTGIDRVKVALLVSNLRDRFILSVTNIGDRRPLTIGINKDYSKWTSVPNNRDRAVPNNRDRSVLSVPNNRDRAVPNNRDRSVPNNGDTIFKERKKALKKKEERTSEDHQKPSSDPPAQLMIYDPLKPNCPHGEIIALYHSLCSSLPAVKDWTPTRQSLLKARWSEDIERQSIEWWKSFFSRVSTSDFLMGRTKDWMADLEWLVKPKNFLKVIEGRYDNRQKPSSGAEREAFLRRFQGRTEGAN